ncbi:MAG: DUF4214 domain-containing protein [Actinomycetia bacterium]|nr:DUF4214 domain-containing protein [Actinomycetes bacterium]MCP4224325.1 DUF4214 domain-containing protein [Actinomycetes bacterium]MCP5034983.1 DUF4214 domain-containing protein [Actinomycetes bacterium]
MLATLVMVILVVADHGPVGADVAVAPLPGPELALIGTPAPAAKVEGLPRPAVPGADDATIDSVTRLYLAVFGRLPDPDGHSYWVAQQLAGADLTDVAAAFMVSTEWSTRYGSVDTGGFVDLLYGNVLQRSADGGGRQYWHTVLDRGVTRTQVLLQFSESDEFVHRTGTTPPRPPYPAVPAGSGSGRRIVYDNSSQRVWLVEADGAVYDSYLVSGRRNIPSPGLYSVFSKSPKAWAGHGGITMNHMVRFARGRSLAIGFHSIPIRSGGTPLQTLAQLGTFRSAGCVRQSGDKAQLLYHWAGIGTTVVVLG